MEICVEDCQSFDTAVEPPTERMTESAKERGSAITPFPGAVFGAPLHVGEGRGQRAVLGAAVGSSYDCIFIRAGRPKCADQTPSDWLIPAEVLRASVHLFDARPCYIDHAMPGEAPSVRRLAGVTFAPTWDDELQAITGGLRLYAEGPDSPGAFAAALLDQLLADQDAGRPVPPVGLSAVFFHQPALDEVTGLTTTTGIRYVESVDIVYDAAAGGAVRAALAALTIQGDTHMPPEQSTTTPQNEEPVRSTMISDDPAGASPSPSGARARAAEAQGRGRNSFEARLAAVETQLAAQDDATTVTGMGRAIEHLYGGRSGLDQVSVALDALLEGRRPAGNIPPLTGIRELYMLLSGDYEMAGVFNRDRVSLANVTSATMASLTANALNKRVMNMFQTYPRWWEPIVDEQDFSSLQVTTQAAPPVVLGMKGEPVKAS